MASVSKLDSDGRKGFRVRFYSDKRLREIYLAGLTKRHESMANKVAAHCEDLSKAKSNNVAPSAEAMAWANGTEGNLRENLVAWGLVEPTSTKLTTDEGRLLGAYLTAYIDGRSDVKPVTRTNYKQTRRLLVEYFGENHSLKAITKADAERWRRWMMSEKALAVASVSKHGKRAKTMLSDAVKDRLLAESPFADLKGGNESNSERHRFIGPDVASKVLAACPDDDWRLIFTLARFGGLRCPSEVLALRWSDVDWSAGRLRIESSKTGLRFFPMFPEIRTALQDSFESAPDGAVYCVERYRGAMQNLRTQFGRILERASVEPWPKLFVNLRSTRRTELQEKFPDHVVNKWLGHSGKVAEKHYLQVTEEHWTQAGAFRTHAGSHITNHQGDNSSNHETTKPSVLLGSDGCLLPLMGDLVTPTGIEPVLPP